VEGRRCRYKWRVLLSAVAPRLHANAGDFHQTPCLAFVCSVSRPSEPQRDASGAIRPRVVRATRQEVLVGEDVKGRRARGQANDVTGDANRILGQLDTLQGTLDTISRDLPGAPRGARPGRPRSLASAAVAAGHAGCCLCGCFGHARSDLGHLQTVAEEGAPIAFTRDIQPGPHRRLE